MKSVQYVAEDTYQKLIDEGRPTVVMFTASWCGPCKAMKPLMEELAAEMGFKLAYADVEKERTLTERLKIRSVPTLKVFNNGKQAGEFSGMRPRDAIKTSLFQAGFPAMSSN